MTRITSIILFFCISFVTISAKPPKPPKGYRWVINAQFSDEFDGNELDQSKWMNEFNGGWKGRQPAWFNPEAVSVSDGNLKIKSGALSKTKKFGKAEYTMYGGAVSSITKEAHFGYYECKAKASKIAMSTTFWMSNDKVPFTENDDCETDSYSQELDIQEAVGGSTTFEKFRNGMNSNTHYRYVKCGEKKETFISKGSDVKLKSNVYDAYHIYAAWWKDAHEVTFYANDEESETVQFRTDISKKPFDRPMQINMVTETYNWQPAPSVADLENPEINTAYYDWVRSYSLVPINKKTKCSYAAQVFEANVEAKTQLLDATLKLDYTYEANEDCKLYISVKNGDTTLKSIKLKAYKGLGNDELELKLKSSSAKQVAIKLVSNSGKVLIEKDFNI